MKLSKIAVTLWLAAGALVLSPSVRAQTNTSTNDPAPARPRMGRSIAEGRTAYLTQQLSLTADQKPKVQAVIEEEFKALQELPREERREKIPLIREETVKKLKAILTEEQFAKYQSLPQRGPGRRGSPTNTVPEQPGGGEKKVETPNQ